MSEASRLAGESTAAFEAAVEATSPAEQAAELEVAQDAAGDSALAGAYIFLQKLVGGIAVALPFVVAIGNFALGGDELEGSISAYYYTPMGNVFVGALCALGVFFLSYQHKPLPGYELDNGLSYGASAAAIGVALFPTAEHEAKPWTGEWLVSTTHLVCACALFLLLAYFSLKLFTKTDKGQAHVRRETQAERRLQGLWLDDRRLDRARGRQQHRRPAGLVELVVLARDGRCHCLRDLVARQERYLRPLGRSCIDRVFGGRRTAGGAPDG